jgi:Xaa-Pro dipeptidase
MGLPDSLDTLMAKYDIDEAIYADQLNARLASASIVYTLPIVNTSKVGAGVKLCSAEQSKQLHTAFADARAIKSEWEVEIIRKANKISSDAHVKVKRHFSPGKKKQVIVSHIFIIVNERSSSGFQ